MTIHRGPPYDTPPDYERLHREGKRYDEATHYRDWLAARANTDPDIDSEDPLYDTPLDYERIRERAEAVHRAWGDKEFMAIMDTEPSGSFAKGLRNGIAIALLIWALLFGLAWLIWHGLSQ